MKYVEITETLFIIIINFGNALPPVTKLGAIFTEDERNGPAELAFKHAVYEINMDNALLGETTLRYDIQYVHKVDSFHASKKACQHIANGVQAIFGPTNHALWPHVQSICDALDIPHMEARLDLNHLKSSDFSINLYPSHHVLNKAFMDVMAFLNWTKVAVIFEKNSDLLKLQELMNSCLEMDMRFLIRQGTPANYREILKEIKNEEIFNIIVDTKPEHLNSLLRGILNLQMNDYKYHYLLTTFDIETFDLEDFKYNFVNLTAFRLVDSSHYRVKETFKNMEAFGAARNSSILKNTRVIQAEPALIHDSVFAFALGLHALERSHSLRVANLSCESELPWDDGSSLYNYINSVEFRGITGPVQFKEGKRSKFKLDLLKLKQHTLVKVGEWSPSSGVNITDEAAFYDPGTMNVTLLVTTNLDRPFIMMRRGKNFTGNSRFYGFCVDLLQEVSVHAGFEYILELNPEKVYGARDAETGEWNGIVKYLMTGKADLAIGSMTINYAREEVIDFTKPFMNVGISILYKVSESEETVLFSFLRPLSPQVWLYTISAYVLVSFTLFIVARFSPYEWHTTHSCSQEEVALSNHFSLRDSFWFTIGTLMQQESQLNPKAFSTRIVSGVWWFFAIVIISSYTANLAAFLTVQRMSTPIESAEDLAGQTEIAYGSTESGSTMTFFRDSKMETYKKMWRFMINKKPSVFVQSYDEGVSRVLQGGYAFLMESSLLDYYAQRNCNLTQIGGMLDSKSYGIATPMGSQWRDKISLAILELQEKGVIHMLYNKWWKTDIKKCDRDNRNNKAASLGIDYIGGVFIFLIGGVAVALFVAILEFCFKTKQTAQFDRQSIAHEMIEEFCFAVRCKGTNQRPALRSHCQQCLAADKMMEEKGFGFD